MATLYDRIRPRSRITLRVEALLSRYPGLSEHELAELTNLVPRLNMLDQGLMTADNRLAEKLAAFHRDHGAKLKLPRADVVATLAFPALFAIFILWWALT